MQILKALFLKTRHSLNKIGLVALAVVSLITHLGILTQSLLPHQNLTVDFLDVGQGDGTLIRTPEGLTILIDSGKGKAILPQLDASLGIKKIDLVIITHPDADHFEGLVVLSRYYSLGTIVMQSSNSAMSSVIQSNLRSNTEVRDVHADESFKFGCCVKIKFLWPTLGAKNANKLSANDLSYVFLLSYLNQNMWFSGDVSKAQEEWIANNYELPAAVIYKAGHHGSRSSSSEILLDELDSSYAVISAGKDNSYGHPHAEVLENLKDKNMQIFRTDEVGSIRFSFADNEWKVESK